ncbi:hypothetical protein [Marinospirillum sp.]|uniref:hypothetical protein n=1 Tax=Marinospirillum sp. TaxID=2183934 RepID=UPI002870B101|nr:hypothetical protein [Marinospirillum sp.]MDR9468022.1 hypothetical protein [Marinospirillum sp.]
MTESHKGTIQKGFLLRRKLPIEGLDERQWKDFVQELNHLPYVDFAEHKPTNKLDVIYDGSHWSLDELLELLKDYGGYVKAGWWIRKKLSWYQFTDENVRANARHEPFCCSKIPPMKRK